MVIKKENDCLPIAVNVAILLLIKLAKWYEIGTSKFHKTTEDKIKFYDINPKNLLRV